MTAPRIVCLHVPPCPTSPCPEGAPVAYGGPLRNAAEMREAAAQAIEVEGREHPGAEHHYAVAAAVVRALPLPEPSPAPSPEEMADTLLAAAGYAPRSAYKVAYRAGAKDGITAERARAATRERELAAEMERLKRERDEARSDERVRCATELEEMSRRAGSPEWREAYAAAVPVFQTTPKRGP